MLQLNNAHQRKLSARVDFYVCKYLRVNRRADTRQHHINIHAYTRKLFHITDFPGTKKYERRLHGPSTQKCS